MGRLKNFLIILFILCIPLVTVLGAFRLTAFNMHFYEDQFNKYEPGVENAVMITVNTLHFLKESDVGEDYISEYTQEEQKHLVEVKGLINNSIIVLYSVLVFLVAIGILLYLVDKDNFLVNQGIALFYGGGFSAIIISVFLFLFSCCFDLVFVQFHKMFFTSTWQFSASSLLIRLFPRIFFIDILIKIIVGAYAVSIFLSLIGFYLVKKKKYLEKEK